MLTEVLASTYGPGIANAVVNELGFTHGSDSVVAPDTVAQAMEMAQTCSDAFMGVDFATRLYCSAVSGGPSFRSACETLNIAHAALGIRERHRIDMAMQGLFEQAALRGQSPVPMETAKVWLHSLLRP